MRITNSTLRKIIREELEVVVREDATQRRFNALQNAQADILNALGQLRTSLSIAQRKGIPKLAAMVVDGDMTVKSAANKLRASIRSIREDAAKELSKN
jgi:hypothetical protein